MRRVVADTNILVSALMFGGLPGAILDLALLHGFDLVTSPVLLDELNETLLGEKFAMSPEDVAAIRVKLEAVAALVEPRLTLDVIAADPDDNRILECAVEGRADCIVSGDRHLLGLREYEGIPIYSARQFLDELRLEL